MIYSVCMQKINKNYIFILAIIILLTVAFFGYGLFMKKQGADTKKNNYSVEIIDGSSVFTDYKYAYRIKFIDEATIEVEDNYKLTYSKSLGGGEHIIDRLISFYDKETDTGIMSISINKTDVTSLGGWLDERNDFFKPLNKTLILNKKIKLDGVDAIIVNEKDKIEEYPYNTIVFLKDSYLFEVNIGVKNIEEVWESFYFID